MPRHPPCALKNLPHDHRTHRPTTTTTGPLPPGEGPAARSTGRRSITNLRHHNPRRDARRRPQRLLRHQFLRCSRPLYSSQTTTHTPHTHGREFRPSGRHRRRRGAGNQRHLTTHHEPTTPPTTAPRTGDQQRRNRCARVGACCLRTQQCAMDRSSTGTSPTVPPPPRPPGQPGSPR